MEKKKRVLNDGIVGLIKPLLHRKAGLNLCVKTEKESLTARNPINENAVSSNENPRKEEKTPTCNKFLTQIQHPKFIS